MRVVRNLSDLAKKGNVDMEIPNVGVFRVRSGIAAVTFSEFLLKDTKGVTNKSITEKKLKGEMKLTKDTIKNFEKFIDFEDSMTNKNDEILEIDVRTQNFLKNSMNIDVNPIYCSPTNN